MGCGNLKTPPREVHFSGCINESYAFNCTGGDFFVKINRYPCNSLWVQCVLFMQNSYLTVENLLQLKCLRAKLKCRSAFVLFYSTFPRFIFRGSFQLKTN